MLNIRCRWHPWMKSFKTPPHTGGTCLRQQSRVTLSSADKIIQSLWAKGKVAPAASVKKGQGGQLPPLPPWLLRPWNGPSSTRLQYCLKELNSSGISEAFQFIVGGVNPVAMFPYVYLISFEYLQVNVCSYCTKYFDLPSPIHVSFPCGLLIRSHSLTLCCVSYLVY
jgi:hypothetical protein